MGERLSTKKLTGMRVVDAVKGKRIGKVRHFVFHPSERRLIGFTVKRPDAALMFHRKDLFVALDGFSIEDGEVLVRTDDAKATDKGALKAAGVDWDTCVLWVGMPLLTESDEFLGYVSSVAFDPQTGKVLSVTTENGAASDIIVGTRTIPGELIRGFKRGRGAALINADDYQGEDEAQLADRGAILVADEAAQAEMQGGVAAAAGKATAVVTDKAKKGASAAKAAADEKLESARPAAQKAARVAEKAVNDGAFVVGRQIGRASGMFAAFKEELEKAARDDSE